MIVSLLALLQITSDPRLADLFPFTSLPEVSLQSECQLWIDPEDGDQASMEADLQDWSVLCLETPMSNLPTLDDPLEDLLTTRGWEVTDAMGYTSVYSHQDDSHCPRILAVSLMTKGEPEYTYERHSAETAVLVLMTAKEDLDACS